MTATSKARTHSRPSSASPMLGTVLSIIFTAARRILSNVLSTLPVIRSRSSSAISPLSRPKSNGVQTDLVRAADASETRLIMSSIRCNQDQRSFINQERRETVPDRSFCSSRVVACVNVAQSLVHSIAMALFSLSFHFSLVLSPYFRFPLSPSGRTLTACTSPLDGHCNDEGVDVEDAEIPCIRAAIRSNISMSLACEMRSIRFTTEEVHTHSFAMTYPILTKPNKPSPTKKKLPINSPFGIHHHIGKSGEHDLRCCIFCWGR